MLFALNLPSEALLPLFLSLYISFPLPLSVYLSFSFFLSHARALALHPILIPLQLMVGGGWLHPFKVQKLAAKEVLMVNIGSLSTGGRVLAVKADLAKIVLTQPVCTEIGEKIALSRRIDKHWRLIGWGQIRKGDAISTAGGQ